MMDFVWMPSVETVIQCISTFSVIVNVCAKLILHFKFTSVHLLKPYFKLQVCTFFHVSMNNKRIIEIIFALGVRSILYSCVFLECRGFVIPKQFVAQKQSHWIPGKVLDNDKWNLKHENFSSFFGVIDFKVLCIFNAEIKGRKEFFNPINACDSQYVLKVHHLYNWNRYVSGLLVCLSMKTRSPLDVLVWCHLPSWAIWSPPTLRPQFRPARLSRLRTRDNLQKVSIRISTSISNLNLEFVIKLLSQHV